MLWRLYTLTSTSDGMKLRIEISFRLKRIYRMDIASACKTSICIIHKMKWNKMLNCKIERYC